MNEFAPGPKNDGEEPAGNDLDAAYAYIQKNYPSAKKYAVRRANKGFRAVDHPKYRDSGDPAGIDQAMVRTSLAHQTGVKDAIKYLQLQLNSNFSGSKDVSFTIGWSWYVFENPKTGIAVLYYADRGMGGDELVVAGKTPQMQAQAREVFRDAGVLPTPTPRKKQGVAEGTETDGWYVLDTKNRKIIANDVSKERASAIAKAGGYSMWQTEDGTFINSTRSVRYPGLGWIDVSEGVAEAAGSSSFRKGQKVLIVKQGVIATVTKVDKKWGYITVQTNDGRMAQIDERQFKQIKAYHGPMLSPSVTSEMTELLKNGTSPDEVADIMRLPVEVVAEFMPNRQGVAEAEKKTMSRVATSVKESRVEINRDAPDNLYDIQDKLAMSRWKSSVKNVITSLFAKRYPGVQLFFKNTQWGNLFVTTDKTALASEDVGLYSDTNEFGASIIGPTAEYGVDDILYVGIGFDSIKSGKYKGIVGEMLNTIVPPLAAKFKAKPAIVIVVEDQSGGAWEAMANKLGWAFISGEDEQRVTEGQFNSKQAVVDYFVSKGKSAAAGAGAWERGWRGTAPKKKTPARPVRSYHDDLDDKRYKSMGEDANTGTNRRRLESSVPTAGSTRTQTKQTRGNDEKIAGRYDPEDFDAMVQRVGQKAKEQQKRHPVDIADLARRMKASTTK